MVKKVDLAKDTMTHDHDILLSLANPLLAALSSVTRSLPMTLNVATTVLSYSACHSPLLEGYSTGSHNSVIPASSVK